jgi:biopolymer transport protein ExbD
MSHVPATDSIKAEPNLVPLLDLVFQLIMFFMICVNFVSEQVNEDIKLPIAQSARPMEKGEVDVLFLNMDHKGSLIVSGRQKPLLTRNEMGFFLRQQHDDALRVARERGDASGRIKTAVIIRADRDATYAQVYELLQLCKANGYHKLQLRAKSKAIGG